MRAVTIFWYLLASILPTCGRYDAKSDRSDKAPASLRDPIRPRRPPVPQLDATIDVIPVDVCEIEIAMPRQWLLLAGLPNKYMA